MISLCFSTTHMSGSNIQWARMGKWKLWEIIEPCVLPAQKRSEADYRRF